MSFFAHTTARLKASNQGIYNKFGYFKIRSGKRNLTVKKVAVLGLSSKTAAHPGVGENGSNRDRHLRREMQSHTGQKHRRRKRADRNVIQVTEEQTKMYR